MSRSLKPDSYSLKKNLIKVSLLTRNGHNVILDHFQLPFPYRHALKYQAYKLCSKNILDPSPTKAVTSFMDYPLPLSVNMCKDLAINVVIT